MRVANSGRPVRFFLILMGGWTAVRFASGMIGIATPPEGRLPTALPRLADGAAGGLQDQAMARETVLPSASPS